MTISIQALTSSDLPFLWDICAAAAYVADAAAARSHTGLARYVEGWGKRDDFALVAWDVPAGLRAGAIWMRRFPSSDPGYGYFDEHTPEMGLAVLEAYRSAGVGRRLLVELLGFAETRYPGVTLSVFDWNHAAIRLYQSAGFAKFGEYRNSGGTVSWQMRVELPRAARP